MTEIKVGTVRIRRDRTTWGEDAFCIENVDGHNESVMFWMDDWPDLLEAIEKIRPYMEASV